MSTETKGTRLISVEGALGALALAACLILTVVVWIVVGQQQVMWPLPGIDLVEVVLLTLLGAWGLFRADNAGVLLAWVASGMLLAFSVIDGSSIGLYYLPVAALLGLAGVWCDRQAWNRLPLHVCAALVTAWAQAALLLILVRVFAPNAVF